MKEAHMIVQGKGGVGKSFASMILAQYMKEAAANEVFCFDTDPAPQTAFMRSFFCPCVFCLHRLRLLQQ